MSEFIEAAKSLIYPNGVSITITAVTEGAYNADTGTVTNTETTTVVTAFPKVVKVNAYNMPNLIGKEVVEYLVVATDIAAQPRPQDKITRGAVVYSVDSVREHVAQGEVVIYRIIAVKG
jgi:hypothetical protein